MAFLNNAKQQIKVAPDAPLVAAAEELGVPFSCTEGNCGTCLVRVLRGMEHLKPLNEQEDIFGLHANERLLCQARVSPEAPEDAVIEIKP